MKEQDKRLERIVAKDKGYSTPRCAYCTDAIQQEDDAKFPVFPDGKAYPVHKACNAERAQTSSSYDSKALEGLIASYELKRDELRRELEERQKFSIKRAGTLLTESTVAFFGTKITTGQYDNHKIGNDLLKVIISSLFTGMAYPAGLAIPCFIGAYSTVSIMQAMGEYYHGWRRTRELEEEQDLTQRQIVGARIDFMNRKRNDANLKLKGE